MEEYDIEWITGQWAFLREDGYVVTISDRPIPDHQYIAACAIYGVELRKENLNENNRGIPDLAEWS